MMKEATTAGWLYDDYFGVDLTDAEWCATITTDTRSLL